MAKIFVLGLGLVFTGCSYFDGEAYEGKSAREWKEAYDQLQADMFNATRDKPVKKDETEVRQECLSLGYVVPGLHKCPAQVRNEDFDYICSDRHVDGLKQGREEGHKEGYAKCVADYGVSAEDIEKKQEGVKEEAEEKQES